MLRFPSKILILPHRCLRHATTSHPSYHDGHYYHHQFRLSLSCSYHSSNLGRDSSKKNDFYGRHLQQPFESSPWHRSSTPLFELLDADQKLVAEHQHPQAIIVAGPGTGKTVTAAARSVHLIRAGLAQPDQILILSHSDNNAQQIQHVVDIHTGLSSNPTIASSISFFASTLLEDHNQFGLTHNQWLNELQISVLMENHAKRFHLVKFDPKRAPNMSFKLLVNYFHRLESLMITPEKYLVFAKDMQANVRHASQSLESFNTKKSDLILQCRLDNTASHLELAKAYHTYASVKTEFGLLAINDRVPMATKLISQSIVRSRLLQRFKFIITDQLEDWSRADLAFFKELALFPESLESRGLTLFGDDDQAIMEWAGAPRDTFSEIISMLPNAKIMSLHKNYRHDYRIAKLARNLISRNSKRLEQTLAISRISSLSIQQDKDELDLTEKNREYLQILEEKLGPKLPALGSAPVWIKSYESDIDEYHAIAEVVQNLLDTVVDKRKGHGHICDMSEDGSPHDQKLMDHCQTPHDHPLSFSLSYPRIAIITRYRAEAAAINKFLHQLNLPVSIPLAQHEEIKFLMNLLQILFQPNSCSIQIYDLLSSGMFSIPSHVLARVMELHQKTEEPLHYVLDNYLQFQQQQPLRQPSYQQLCPTSPTTNTPDISTLLSSPTSNSDASFWQLRVKKLLSIIHFLQSKLAFYSLTQLIYAILKETQILNAMRHPTMPHEHKQSNNIASFLSMVEETELKLKNSRPYYVWSIIKKQCAQKSQATRPLASKSMDEGLGLIFIGTIWNTKGSEFDYVIVPNCKDDIYPGRFKSYELLDLSNQIMSIQRSEKIHVEFMRRAFYVAMTRTKVATIFTFNKQSKNTPSRTKKMSRFLFELLAIPNSVKFSNAIDATSSTMPVQNYEEKRDPDHGCVFGSGHFSGVRSGKNGSLLSLNLQAIQVYLRCPLQYYHQFDIRLMPKIKPIGIFQQAIANIFTLLNTNAVDPHCLSSFDTLRKVFDNTWETYGIDPLSNPEMYENGMDISERMLDLGHGLDQLLRCNEPWQFTISPLSHPLPLVNDACLSDDWEKEPMLTQEKERKVAKEANATIHFRDLFQRIYTGHHIRHFFQFTETSPPEQTTLHLLAKILCYAYYHTHKIIPASVTLEYITSRYEMKILKLTPTQAHIIDIEPTINEIAKLVSNGIYQAISDPITCKKCPYGLTCPKSSNPQSS